MSEKIETCRDCRYCVPAVGDNRDFCSFWMKIIDDVETTCQLFDTVNPSQEVKPSE